METPTDLAALSQFQAVVNVHRTVHQTSISIYPATMLDYDGVLVGMIPFTSARFLDCADSGTSEDYDDRGGRSTR